MGKITKTSYIVVNSLILVLSITICLILSFVANGALNFPNNDNGNLAIYIVDKVVVSLGLVAITLLHVFNLRHEAVVVQDIIATLAVQFLPLAVRLFALIPDTESWMWGLNLGISVLTIVIYVSVLVLMSIVSKRFTMVKEEVKPTEMKVESNAKYFNAEGEFKGPKGE